MKYHKAPTWFSTFRENDAVRSLTHAVHHPTEAELDRLGPGVGNEFFEALDFRFGLVAAFAARPINGDVAFQRAAEEVGSDRLAVWPINSSNVLSIAATPARRAMPGVCN